MTDEPLHRLHGLMAERPVKFTRRGLGVTISPARDGWLWLTHVGSGLQRGTPTPITSAYMRGNRWLRCIRRHAASLLQHGSRLGL